jgi:hypothetical protein
MIIVSPFWISHIIWRLSPIRDLALVVIDYTVPTFSYSHHRGLFWLLNHLRIFGPNTTEPWQVDKNYVGYKPDNNVANHYISEIDLTPYHWLYLSDTYGVYDIDIAKKPEKELPESVRPKLVFGSLTLSDAHALSRFVEKGGNIILEFNSFASPTKDDARVIAESLVGLQWTGWAGRFIDDLYDKTITPSWLPDLYHIHYPNRPLPKGPVLILVHNDGRLVVLHGETLENTSPSLSITDQGKKMLRDLYATPPYFGWFAIMAPIKSVQVLAEIRLPVALDWKNRYRDAGIPTAFPLITQHRENGTTRIYIAANIADLEDTPRYYELAGLPLLQAAVNRRRDIISNRPAYWQFYAPLVGEMLKRVSSERN